MPENKFDFARLLFLWIVCPVCFPALYYIVIALPLLALCGPAGVVSRVLGHGMNLMFALGFLYPIWLECRTTRRP